MIPSSYKSIILTYLVLSYFAGWSLLTPFIAILVKFSLGYFSAYMKLFKCRKEHQKKLEDQIEQIRSKVLDSEFEKLVTFDINSKIVNATGATDILELLGNKKISSKNLVKFYLKRCVEVGVYHNAVCDFVIDSSLEFADIQDKERQNGKLRSPLHGLPVSIKSNIFMKGFDSHIGFATFFGKKHEKDCLFLESLKDLGCIPFVRSNCPTASISNDGYNEITGTVQNPMRQDRAPGGSSSGEAALIYLRCSPQGFGTDNAGSIRLPSLFQGIYGIMFSQGRVTNQELQNVSPKTKIPNFTWRTQFGVMSRDARDLEMVTKCQVENEKMYENDSEITKLAWNHSESYGTYSDFLNEGTQTLDLNKANKKLRFCYIDKIEDFPQSKPIKLALETTIEILKKNGHQVDKIEVEKWDSPNWKFYIDNIKIISCHMIQNQKENMDENILTNEPFLANLVQNTPSVVSWLIVKSQKILGYQKEAEQLEILFTHDNARDLMEKLGWWEEFRGKIYNIMRQGQYDSLLLPGGLVPAYPLGKAKDFGFLQSIFMFPNSMKMCSGCVPIRKVEKEEEVYIAEYNNKFTSTIRSGLQGSTGLPVGIQVCGLQFEEEKCLKSMIEIQRLVNYKD